MKTRSLEEPSLLQFFSKSTSYWSMQFRKRLNLNFIVEKTFSKSRWGGNCSSRRRDWLFSSSQSPPSRDPRGSRRPVGATRLPCAISPSTFFFALLSSRPLFLSLPRPPHAFRYTHRPAWTPAIRLTVEEMRTLEARRGIDLRDDFSDLAALWFITRAVGAMKNALQRARLNKSPFCESHWHFSTCKVSEIIALLLRSIIKLYKSQAENENLRT